MNWTDERVETLKKLWAEGLSASQIAAQLGGVSRNAVIGKVHRLKLSSRGRATSQRTRQKKAPQTGTTTTRRPRNTRPVTATIGATALQVHFEEEPVAATYLQPVGNVVVPISRKLALVQLTENTCKWPNGDPLSEEFSFCGNEAGDAGPYCAYHSRIAYQPASERRRAR
ncbi:GcrA family cell cycle regulator [Nitratireductor sp. ZSWI3]|uniref:GcrA family cell cycle regulator n=1 Tax=Nitratireductor sp. ZSWI3 TaxID=2966359 RepID=UPI00214FEE52|nr:GcrA family cell cycle regulator [Nitratireductor sp. ZSWI3]MCR4267184.1 GcrA family cell cycle regulator [Nitratireductor sp. ZSWI3]